MLMNAACFYKPKARLTVSRYPDGISKYAVGINSANTNDNT
jgi:hypothetical protein